MFRGTRVAMAIVGIGAVSVYAQDGKCNDDNWQEEGCADVGRPKKGGHSFIQKRATANGDHDNKQWWTDTWCECETPNAGTAHHNKYTCKDGSSGWCGKDEMCYLNKLSNFRKGVWSDACSVTCTCDTPGAGTAHFNKYTCTDGSSSWCKSNEYCVAKHPWPKANKGYGPSQRPHPLGAYGCDWMTAEERRKVPYGTSDPFYLNQILPNNPVAQKDAQVVPREVRLSAFVTIHDTADAKTMQRAESLKNVLGVEFKGQINEALLNSSPALQSMMSSRPIKVVDRGDGRHIVADGNGRIQAMKLAFVDHSAVNVAVDEVVLGQKEKRAFLESLPMLRAAADDHEYTEGFHGP